MLFNSIDFALFLPIVFLLYWFVFNKLKIQNLFITFVSYLFYGWWDWRFLGLIFFSSLVDYAIGILLKNQQKILLRKVLLGLSLSINLGFLGFFKYYNFFVDNFVQAFTLLGHSFQPQTLQIILPVGISFYTFQTLSYSIDVYRRNLEPTTDFWSFFAYVSFFPQLVAGPIERASNLLPQFYVARKFDYAKVVCGLRQILWGLFKKMVIADNAAELANQIFNNSSDYSGSTLFLGALFFAFQIYGDFSGYSDIAIGTARLFGFSLMQNFAFPYFSRDIAEFWRRWHISLSTWFRDYVYIPLGGSKGSNWLKLRNTFIIFLLSGFWHGANWTFVAWGALNAIYFLPLLLFKRNRKNMSHISIEKNISSIKTIASIVFTFVLTIFAWIFFRAENLQQAFEILSAIFSASLFKIPEVWSQKMLLLLVFFVAVEWKGRHGKFALEKFGLNSARATRWIFYGFLVFLILVLKPTEEIPFIYFQF
jgi:D-alanyl-lipoteichoic acid acyltransferase DltB (MBOAT superfamily)